MMEEAVEHSGYSCAVAKQFPPVIDGSVRSNDCASALIASHDDLQEFLGGGEG